MMMFIRSFVYMFNDNNKYFIYNNGILSKINFNFIALHVKLLLFEYMTFKNSLNTISHHIQSLSYLIV